MNPNGGDAHTRSDVTALGLPFYRATPDNPYPTTTYTLGYDGFADFPRYPLNVLSISTPQYSGYSRCAPRVRTSPAQIASAARLPTQGDVEHVLHQ